MADTQYLLQEDQNIDEIDDIQNNGILENFVLHEKIIENVRKSYKLDKKKSFVENVDDVLDNYQKKHKSSSIRTIFALVNSIVGSIVLLIPGSFNESGFALSIIIMTLIGLIQHKTASWIVRHAKHHEEDCSVILKRLLGEKWRVIFCAGSGLLMFTIGIIYFNLVNSTMYTIIQFIALRAGVSQDKLLPTDSSLKDLSFSTFSVQWQCIILIIILFPLFFLKDMKQLVKIARFGASAIYCYLIYIIYIFGENVYTGVLSENIASMPQFTSSVAGVIGNFSLAFMVHNAVLQIMSTNAVKDKNERDLSFGYLAVWFVYFIIGVFGSLGLLGRKQIAPGSAIIYNFFEPTNVSVFIIAVIFGVHLVTVYPFFLYISRSQIFILVFGEEKLAPRKYYLMFNFSFAFICFLVQFINIDIGIMIGLCGAVIGFLVAYIVPCQIHYQTLLQQQEIDKANQQPVTVPVQKRQASINPETDKQSLLEPIDSNKGSNIIEIIRIKGRNPLMILLLFLGFGMAVIQFLQIFNVNLG